jgi:hypothetical protein
MASGGPEAGNHAARGSRVSPGRGAGFGDAWKSGSPPAICHPDHGFLVRGWRFDQLPTRLLPPCILEVVEVDPGNVPRTSSPVDRHFNVEEGVFGWADGPTLPMDLNHLRRDIPGAVASTTTPELALDLDEKIVHFQNAPKEIVTGRLKAV